MSSPSYEDVDWEEVEAALRGIHYVWKEPNFDTLPHVVEVLTRYDPSEALDSLRQTHKEIEKLVDTVVDKYHGSFNKAINNYSQILSLFSHSGAEMTGLKKSIEDAKRLLSNRHKTLHQLWYRSITLRHVLTLMDHIDSIAKVPAKIEQLMSQRKFYAAVQCYVQTITNMEREGLAAIGALKDVKYELSNLKSLLFVKVLDELQLHLYNKGQYSRSQESDVFDIDDVSSIPVLPVVTDPPMHPLAVSQGLPSISSSLSSSASSSSSSAKGSGKALSAVSLSDASGEGGEGGKKLVSASSSSSAANNKPAWLAGAESDEFVDRIVTSPFPEDVRYCECMVECLSLLGKLAAAGNTITQRVRPSIRELILVEIRNFSSANASGSSVNKGVRNIASSSASSAPSASSSSSSSSSLPHAHVASSMSGKSSSSLSGPPSFTASSSRFPSSASVGGGAGKAATPASVSPISASSPSSLSLSSSPFASSLRFYFPLANDPFGPSASLAHTLLESVLKLLLRILETHAVIAELFDRKSTSGFPSSHGESSSSRRSGGRARDSHGHGGEEGGGFATPTGGYSVAYVWSCVQGEVQQLICDMLKTNADGSGGGHEASMASRMSAVNSAISTNVSQGVSFSFKFGDGTGSDGLLLSSSVGKKSFLLMSASVDAHGNVSSSSSSSSSYGTSSVLPERSLYLAAACYRPTLQFTDRVCHVLPEKFADLGRLGLRPFIDGFVRDNFLPSMRGDYRSKVADALTSPSAFRPKAKSLSSSPVYHRDVEKGRPVLHGPLTVLQLVQEIFLWALAMPVYSSDLFSLVHSLLERTLERCRAIYTETVLGSMSSALVGRADLEALMSRQAASVLLECDGASAGNASSSSATAAADGGSSSPTSTRPSASLPPLLSSSPLGGALLSAAEFEVAREDPPLDSEAHEIESEIFNMLLALSPIKEEHLIFDGSKLVLLAALSDTLEFMAQAIYKLGHASASDPSSLSSTPPPSPLIPSLGPLSLSYQSLAKEALRSLRLETQLQCVYQLQFMPKRSYVNDVDAEEPEDFIVALTSQLIRVDEEMSLYLSNARRCYVFGGICTLAATGIIKALSQLDGINSLGVRQVQRNCIALQQTLSTINANSPQSVQLSLDRVGEFYELLNRPYEALVAYVKEHVRYFSSNEYLSLFKANVPGRVVPADALEKVTRLLEQSA